MDAEQIEAMEASIQEKLRAMEALDDLPMSVSKPVVKSPSPPASPVARKEVESELEPVEESSTEEAKSVASSTEKHAVHVPNPPRKNKYAYVRPRYLDVERSDLFVRLRDEQITRRRELEQYNNLRAQLRKEAWEELLRQKQEADAKERQAIADRNHDAHNFRQMMKKPSAFTKEEDTRLSVPAARRLSVSSNRSFRPNSAKMAPAV
ncbi:hypothetical protein THRCLA_07736 [Thraustotheca clavata]|uniref:Uncharacterized protein n=1 Tax=Thraustotheca clavata TaxID=74557 RepID=A0A1V9ZCF3_9STRA|nr:hypothetical protein THRCLA_07736 [Thraustotheca clavata]